MIESFTFTINRRTRKWGICSIYSDNGNTSAVIYLNNSPHPLRTAIHESIHIALWEVGVPYEIQHRKKVEKFVSKLAQEVVNANSITIS